MNRERFYLTTRTKNEGPEERQVGEEEFGQQKNMDGSIINSEEREKALEAEFVSRQKQRQNDQQSLKKKRKQYWSDDEEFFNTE